MKNILTVVGIVILVVALFFCAIYLYGQCEVIRLSAQANADRAQAQANQAAANKALAEGEKILAQGEADAIRAPAQAAARATDRQSLVMMYYGFLTPLAIGLCVILAIVAGGCTGVVIAPRVRLWSEMRKIEYE